MRPSQAQLPPKLPYVPEFDGLRALAVLAVIALHTMENIVPGGFIGVDVFFVLSGLLITRILAAEFQSTGHIRFLNFYARRFLRLMPAFWLVLCVYVAGVLMQGGHDRHDHLVAALSSALYFMNWTLALHLSGEHSSLSHTWSLAMEEQFYLVMPVVLSIILARAKAVWKPFLGLLAASAAWRTYLVFSGADFERIYNGFDTRAETLLFGCVLATFPIERLAPSARRFWYCPVAVLLLCLFFVEKEWKAVNTFGYSLIAACAAWVLLLILEVHKERGGLFLSWKPLVYVGRISYGVYLWHFPIVVALRRHVVGPMAFAVTVAASLLVASASFYLVETPVLKLKKRFAPGSPAIPDSAVYSVRG